MNNRLFIIFIGLIIILLSPACRSKKQVMVSKPKTVELPSANATLLKTITLNENQFSYYTSRGSASYKDNKQSFDFNVELVMEKDKYVYMNVTAMFGFSVARLWFTQDSICILDILHRKNYVSGYNYISRMANTNLTLLSVQQMFAGNTLFKAEEQQMIGDTLLSYILINYSLGGGQMQSTYYNQASFKVNRSIISEKATGREVRVEYTECYTSGNNCFPKDFNINIRAEKNIECRMNLDYFAFDKKKETKFVVPKNFQTVRM